MTRDAPGVQPRRRRSSRDGRAVLRPARRPGSPTRSGGTCAWRPVRRARRHRRHRAARRPAPSPASPSGPSRTSRPFAVKTPDDLEAARDPAISTERLRIDRHHPKGFPGGLTDAPRHALTASRAIGAYRPAGWSPTPSSSSAIDSSDEWIRSARGITTRRFAGRERVGHRRCPSPRPAALELAGVDAGRTSTPSSSPPSAGTCSDPGRRHRCSPSGSAPTRPRPSTSPRPAPASATASRWPRTWSAPAAPSNVLVVGVERLSDITSTATDRGTAFIFADGAGAAVVGPSDTAGIGPIVWGSDGEQCEAHPQRGPDATWIGSLEDDRARSVPHLAMAGQTRLPLGRRARWPRSPSRRSRRAGVTVDDLDVFIPHQANMRIIDAMAKPAEAARRRRDRPRHRRHRATPRRRRSRSPSTA